MKLTSEQKGYILDKLFIDNLIENDNLKKMIKSGDYDQVAINETEETISITITRIWKIIMIVKMITVKIIIPNGSNNNDDDQQ